MIQLLSMIRSNVNKAKEIRAIFDKNTISVYQAYGKELAIPAIKNQKFVAPFKMDRMTWIKPSFLWMMYRSDWGQKVGQEYILSIKIKREGFQWALDNSCLSHFDPEFYKSREEWKEKLQISPVRIQWDPERDIHLEKLDYRSIQIGLSGEAVYKYANEWIISITDITPLCKKIHSLVSEDVNEAINYLPEERLYKI